MKKTYFLEFISILFIFLFFWDSLFIYPIKTFITMIHESFHGLAAIITGGTIHNITLDGISGKISTSGGFYPVVSISGYLGTSLLGAILIASKHRTLIISLLLIYVVSLLLFYTKFSLSFFIVFGFSALLIYSLSKGKFLDDISFILGSFLVVSSFEDIRTYLFSIPSKTDSGLLADYFGMPFLTLPISLFVSILSLFFLYLGFKSFLKTD